MKSVQICNSVILPIPPLCCMLNIHSLSLEEVLHVIPAWEPCVGAAYLVLKPVIRKHDDPWLAKRGQGEFTTLES